MLRPGACMRFELETIVRIRITPKYQLHNTGRQVKREEKRAPALVLMDVNMFMGTKPAQREVIATDNHVAKGDRDKSNRWRKKRNATTDLATRHFHDTVDRPDCRPGAQCNGREHQPDSSCRKRPRVAECKEDVAHQCR